MNPDTAAIVRKLAERIESLAAEESPAAAFKLLLDTSRDLAPRAAVFLVRHGELRGWGSVGFDTDGSTAIRAFRSGSEEGWLGQVASTEGWQSRPAELGHDPGFSGAPAMDCAAGSIRMRGRTMAVLFAERDSPEQPWAPEALSMLLSIIQLRLELDLARRKLSRESRGVKTAPAAQERPVHPSAAQPESEPEMASEAATTASTAEATSVEPAGPTETPELEAARRFAKLVATDIRLYNEEAVMAGRRDGDLADRLADDLGRGRQTFLKRHGDLGQSGLELLQDAYVQVLAGGDSALLEGVCAD